MTGRNRKTMKSVITATTLCALFGMTAMGITMVQGTVSAATDSNAAAIVTVYKMTDAEEQMTCGRLTPGSWYGKDEKGGILCFNFSLPEDNSVRFFDDNGNALDCPASFDEVTGTYEIQNILLKQTQQFKVLKNDGENAVLFNEKYGRITLTYDGGQSTLAKMTDGIPDGVWYARGIDCADGESGTSDFFIFNLAEGTFDRVSMDNSEKEHAAYSFDSSERNIVLTFDDGRTEKWLLEGGGDNYASILAPTQGYSLNLLNSDASINQRFCNQADLCALAGKYYAETHDGEQREFISDIWHSGDGHIYLTVAEGKGKVNFASMNADYINGVNDPDVIFFEINMLTLKGVDSAGNAVDFSLFT